MTFLQKIFTSIKGGKKKAAAKFLSAGAFLFLWWLLSKIIGAPVILPSPAAVLKKAGALYCKSAFWLSFSCTVLRVFTAFVISVFLGFVTGLLCAFSSFFKDFLSLPLNFIKTTPVIALILVVMFWFNSSVVPVFCAVIMTFPVICEAVQKGFVNTSQKKLLMAENFNFTAFQKFFYVRFYHIKPFFLQACSSVFGMTWKVIAAGEVLSLPKRGSGTMLQLASVQLESESVIVIALTLCFLCLLLQAVLKRIFALFEKLGRFVKKQRLEKALKKEIPGRNGIFSWSEQKTAEEKRPEIENYVLKADQVQVLINGEELFRPLSFTLKKGECAGLTAPTGTGKTCFLNAVAGNILTEKEAENIITVKGNISVCKSSGISFVYQEAVLLEQLSALENIFLPLKNVYGGRQGLKKAEQAIIYAGLQEKNFTEAGKLSGGEKQRINFYRALCMGPELLLLDEPFTSQDEQNKGKMRAALREYLKKGGAVLLVSHNPEDFAAFSAAVFPMEKGEACSKL